MELRKLLVYFETSPALGLLRSRQNAPFVIDFLYRQFKQGDRIVLPYSDLHAALVAYREEIHETHPHALRDKPETYLSNWSVGESRWLHRYLEADHNEPVFQLTPHAEDVLSFLDRVLDQDLGFVGTESRLRLVLETLKDLVVGSSDDPETRLAHLRKERARIEEEIGRIESDGRVTPYRPAQIRERFATAVSLLKQLQGDFRAVEEKFKEITQQVQQQQSEGNATRGGILEFALDSEDLLKQEDQGQSFHEFVRFILSPAQQETLRRIIQELGRIREVSEQADGLETVRRMVPSLLAEAEKVMRTNQRLSATLRRLLDAEAYRDRRRVAQLLREIRGLAASLADDPPRTAVGLELETRPELFSPMARTFWSEPQQFTAVDLSEHVADDDRRAEAFRMLARMQRLDWQGMRSRVRDVVARHEDATLGALLRQHPPQAGVVEVLGYLQIARDDGHVVNADATEEIVLPQNGNGGLALTVPLVRFVPT